MPKDDERRTATILPFPFAPATASETPSVLTVALEFMIERHGYGVVAHEAARIEYQRRNER